MIEQNPSERIASHIDELQKNGYYIASVKKNTQLLSAKILRHIADLHEAGVYIEDYPSALEDSLVGEARRAYCRIAGISRDADVFSSHYNDDFQAILAKNERCLAWMEAHPDPTKTPLELWEEAKLEGEDGEWKVIPFVVCGSNSCECFEHMTPQEKEIKRCHQDCMYTVGVLFPCKN